MVADEPDIANQYARMGIDELLCIAAEQEKLTAKAGEALAQEPQKRGLGSPDAIRQYEFDRDQQIKSEEDHAAAIRESNRSRFERVFQYLKQHPLSALLAALCSPGIAFLIGYGMVTLRIGNGRILSSLVCLTLAFGIGSGAAAARSASRIPIRILGVFIALAEGFYAFVFLFAATVGFR
jgi:hypothetical protein